MNQINSGEVSVEGLEERYARFKSWWNGKGIVTASVINRFGTPKNVRELSNLMSREDAERLRLFSAYPEKAYSHPEEAARLHDTLIRGSIWRPNMIPHAPTFIGPGSLCIFAGSEVESVNGAVWFHEHPAWDGDPNDILFDSENMWWKRTIRYIDALLEASGGEYYVAFPDLVENWDILASLAGPTKLLMDMHDQPELVHQQIQAVNQLYKEVYIRLYERIAGSGAGGRLDEVGKLPAHSERQNRCAAAPSVSARYASLYEAFYLWSPGKTAKLQCDGSAMFGTEMFREFVVPGLQEQAEYIDYTMYHLDGTQSIVHLDSILEMEELNAVEWTPQAGEPEGADSRWYPMYRKILESGKSLQVLIDNPSGVVDLLNAIGTDGIYLLGISDEASAERLKKEVTPFL